MKHALKSHEIVFLQTLIYFNCSWNRLVPMSAEEVSSKSSAGVLVKDPLEFSFDLSSLASLLLPKVRPNTM